MTAGTRLPRTASPPAARRATRPCGRPGDRRSALLHELLQGGVPAPDERLAVREQQVIEVPLEQAAESVQEPVLGLFPLVHHPAGNAAERATRWAHQAVTERQRAAAVGYVKRR